MAESKNKKPLLSESVVKQFMKVANLPKNVSQKFINEKYSEPLEEKEGEDLEEVKTKNQSRGGGGDRLDEQDVVPVAIKEEEKEDEGGETPPPAPEGDHMEPDGDEMAPGGGEMDIAGLVQAIADAITQKTGVPVEVEGGGAGEGEGMPPEGGEGMEQLPPGNEPPMEEPMMESKPPIGDEPKEPKKGKPNEANQGTPKKTPRPPVEGAEKPTKLAGSHPDHKMKELEEQIFRKVLSRLMEEVKKVNAPKDGKK